MEKGESAMTDPGGRSDQFYQERVPAQWNSNLETREAEAAAGDEKAKRTADGMRRVRATLGVIVKDPQGDTHYHLNVAEGRMSAGTSATQEPLLTLLHDLDTFETLERESGDSLLGFLGAIAGQADEMILTERQVQTLHQLSGSLKFERVGDPPLLITAYLGDAIPGGEPSCTLRIDAETYGKLERGESSPQDAFMNGNVTIEGDVQIAMQLALAALAPE